MNSNRLGDRSPGDGDESICRKICASNLCFQNIHPGKALPGTRRQDAVPKVLFPSRRGALGVWLLTLAVALIVFVLCLHKLHREHRISRDVETDALRSPGSNKVIISILFPFQSNRDNKASISAHFSRVVNGTVKLECMLNLGIKKNWIFGTFLAVQW